jgi:flagellar basal body-associated protein FliL
MKKIIIISLALLFIVASAVVFFDSSNTASINNEGIRKPGMATNDTPVLNVSFKLNKHTVYIQF